MGATDPGLGAQLPSFSPSWPWFLLGNRLCHHVCFLFFLWPLQSHFPGGSASPASCLLLCLPTLPHTVFIRAYSGPGTWLIELNKLRACPCKAHSLVGENGQGNQVTIYSPIPNPIALPAATLTPAVCAPRSSLSDPVKTEVRTCHSSAQPPRPPAMAPGVRGKANVLAVTYKALHDLPHCLPLSALITPFQLHWPPCCFSACQACSCLRPLHLPLVLPGMSSPR